MNWIFKLILISAIGMYLMAFSCVEHIVLDKRNIKKFNKIFVGTIIEVEEYKSDDKLQVWNKKITIRIDELFISDSVMNNTIRITVSNDGYFETHDKWLFILQDNYTNYCMSFWMNAKDEVHNNQHNTEGYKENLTFLRKHCKNK